MIKTYINNSNYRVKACQWTGNNFNDLLNLDVFDIFFSDHNAYLHTLEDDIKIRLGDYLVQDECGKNQLYDQIIFESKFTEL